MPSINDWAAKAARVIADTPEGHRYEERITAIIALYAEPILTLLNESRREHGDGECGPPCPRMFDGDLTDVCTCGADVWNARVDAALNGEQK